MLSVVLQTLNDRGNSAQEQGICDDVPANCLTLCNGQVLNGGVFSVL